MILDKDTNKIFLSDLLWQRFYNVAEAMDYHCRENHIQMEIAYATKDIWVRDFMPVQTERDKFIGYLYDPDYLKDLKYQDSRTDGNKLKYYNINIVII